MPQQQRAEGHVQVEVLIPFGVPDARPFAALGHERQMVGQHAHGAAVASGDDPEILTVAVEGLAEAARAGFLGRFEVERADGEAVRDTRLADALVAAGFTPTYKGVPRPWPIGLIHGTDPSFTERVRDGLLADDPDLNVGWNEPYSGLNGVTYTLEHHGDGRGLDATMIEIRHDEILEPAGVALWAHRLARSLGFARWGRAETGNTEQLGSTRGYP